MAKQSPPQLLADEKHTWWRGDKVYVATTVAEGCLLGAELSQTAGSDDLQAAYGVFADESRVVNRSEERRGGNK